MMRRITTWLLFVVLAAFCADRDMAGRYTGEWKSTTSGNGGALRVTLETGPDGSWKCESGFTIEGSDIKTVTQELKVQDSKLDVSYDFKVEGATLRSRMTGDWSGGTFKGRYQTKVVGGDTVDEGTWTVSRVK